MKPFIETEQGKQMIENFIIASKEYEKQNLTKEEQLIAEQKTKLYKFWCGLIYGHLMVNNVCLRCGKVDKEHQEVLNFYKQSV